MNRLPSVPNPFHVLEQNLLPAAIIEFRGAAVGMAGNALSGFKSPVIFRLDAEAGRLEVFVQELLQLAVDGKLFLFAAFLFKAEQKPFSGRIIVFDLQIHESADPGESVSKSAEQSAIAEAGVRGRLDHAQKPLNFTFDKCRRFSFGPRKSLGLDFPGGIHGQNTFFSQPGKQHPDRRHVLFDRGRGLAL